MLTSDHAQKTTSEQEMKRCIQIMKRRCAELQSQKTTSEDAMKQHIQIVERRCAELQQYIYSDDFYFTPTRQCQQVDYNPGVEENHTQYNLVSSPQQKGADFEAKIKKVIMQEFNGIPDIEILF